MQENKIGKLGDITKIVKDGMQVAIGGAWLCNHPMAIIREIIRSKIRDLNVMTVVGSIDIELLLAADCVGKLTFSFVSMEAFGMAPNFRKAIEQGKLSYDEITGLALILGFEAAGRGVPYLPYRGPFGSDCVKVRPEFYKDVKCPFTGEELIGVRAIHPDVAIIHAQRADSLGNVHIEGTSGSDVDMAKASKKVIVSVEEIVPTEEIRSAPEKTKIPGFYVDMIIEAPFGAHPTSCIPHYSGDPWHLMKYMEMANSPETLGQYLNEYVMRPESEYLEAIGGQRQTDLLRKLAQEVKFL